MNLLKKRTIFSMWAAVYIAILFIIAMAWSFVTDKLQLSGFFGDKGNEWGPRHYFYNIMCALLFIMGIVRIAMWADWYWEHNKKQY